MEYPNTGEKKVVAVRPAQVQTPTAQTTTNDYADVGSAIDTIGKQSIAYVIKNTHGSNHIHWKVLGSIDGTTYVEVQAQSEVEDGETEVYSATIAVYRYYKVQVKSVTDGNHGTAQLHCIAKG